MSYNQSITTATPAVPLNTTLEDKIHNITNINYKPIKTYKLLFFIFVVIYLIVKLFSCRLFRCVQAHHRRRRNDNFDLISVDSGYFENFHEDEQEENVD
ncbi:hypothetical protein PGAL8A_00474300 [Plasmodium gallinaceum]|uniref:Uncharacterized protein n=1 Tax=Plasmodium gallinaceum TaxID=5849 RepID=A0A1J1GXI1_PLAGA|nr:hypothetical protein PGAL8A_00474300 [Plasmodium gallinaceum]CRG97164.1 hypothetical protein PGAL8A_00474300 [Plasmodium gallinaceum]